MSGFNPIVLTVIFVESIRCADTVAVPAYDVTCDAIRAAVASANRTNNPHETDAQTPCGMPLDGRAQARRQCHLAQCRPLAAIRYALGKIAKRSKKARATKSRMAHLPIQCGPDSSLDSCALPHANRPHLLQIRHPRQHLFHPVHA